MSKKDRKVETTIKKKKTRGKTGQCTSALNPNIPITTLKVQCLNIPIRSRDCETALKYISPSPICL